MESIRKPFQGVINIIRFNSHTYVVGLIFIVLALIAAGNVDGWQKTILLVLAGLAIFSMVLSLLVSYFIYDRSGLYSLEWLPDFPMENKQVVNIHAGFDETSALLKQKFPGAALTVLDFYDPTLHTERSIKKARKAYPAFPGTIPIETSALPLQPNSADLVCCIFSAHEIRNEVERIEFLRVLKDSLTKNGRIILTEHQRDLPNFLAYNFGFFHFHSPSTWHKNIEAAGLQVEQKIKKTAFITTYILKANGATA